MFIRAGFNPHHRVIAKARVRIGGNFGCGYLVASVPHGELHWRIPNVIREWAPSYLFNLIDVAQLPSVRPSSRLPP